MKNKEPNEVVQWSYDFIKSFYLNNNEILTAEEKIYHHYLYPFAEKYYSSLNPFMLFGGADVGQLLKKDFWMIRDGLIPLSFFFKEASEDLIKGKRKIIIHKDFWSLVPDNWRKNVLFYDIKSHQTFDKKNIPEQLILCGLANETLADPVEFVEDLKAIGSIFSEKDLEKMKILAYFPNKRTDLWGRWQDENIFKYARALFENLKMDIEFPEWDVLKSTMDFKNSLYVEINRGVLVKDSFVQQMFLSRGAGLLKTEENIENFTLVKKVPLSLYHSAEVFECDYSKLKAYKNPLDGDLMPYFKKIIEKGTSPRVLSEGWEKWYGSYVKKYYKAQGLI